MRYVSLFSGIEAASCAWDPLGWVPTAFSEIDPFCCAVLEERFPEVPNLGDVREVDWDGFKGAGRPDIVVGGSPCQSFSYAGGREGLQGESRLMLEYIRAADEMRPRWLVWENVVGALTADGGEAFRQLLSSLDGLGYGLAWRVLDARFFGVPQRRRRLFLVGRLGDPRPAREVLLEPEVLPRDGEACRQGGPGTPGAPVVGPGRAVGFCWDAGVRAPNLSVDDCAPTVRCKNPPAACLCIASTQANAEVVDDCAPTLTCLHEQPVVSRPAPRAPWFEGAERPDMRYELRRLTPLECERVQGFPDGWTDVPFQGAPSSNTRRYRALGNSMAVPVMEWIGRRIAAADRR